MGEGRGWSETAIEARSATLPPPLLALLSAKPSSSTACDFSFFFLAAQFLDFQRVLLSTNLILQLEVGASVQLLLLLLHLFGAEGAPAAVAGRWSGFFALLYFASQQATTTSALVGGKTADRCGRLYLRRGFDGSRWGRGMGKRGGGGKRGWPRRLSKPARPPSLRLASRSKCSANSSAVRNTVLDRSLGRVLYYFESRPSQG